MSKRYQAGMFGGKFLPYHRGHLYCLETASALCEKVWQILLAGCVQEEEILRNATPADRERWSVSRRLARMKAAGERLGNVETLVLDAETPLILNRCGRFDAVFGSEPSYASYFHRAYPWAEYILVDPPRKHYPISGTAIRLGRAEEAKWTV